MRVPITQVYRAFPELDAFSDAECEVYIDYVLKTRGTRFALVMPVALVVCILTSCLALPLMVWLAALMARLVESVGWLSSETALQLLLIPLVLITVGGCGVALLRYRDSQLHRALFASIEEARCPGCKYSLLGLPASASQQVLCPECGQNVMLSPQHRSPRELLQAGAPHTAKGPNTPPTPPNTNR